MKRLFALLAICILSGCATRNKNPNPFQGPTKTIQPDGTVIDNSGKTAAGSGMVSDTSEAQIMVALAAKIQGADWTYAAATRSAVTQPDTVMDSKIEEAHKAALSDAGAALAAGASGNYAKAIAEAASLGGQLIAARTARANAPKPDSGAISTRILSSGEGHAQAAQVGILTFGQTLQAAKRATYAGTSNQSSTDTTNTNDWQGLENLARVYADLEIARVKLEMERIKPTPTKPPVVAPPAEEDDDDEDPKSGGLDPTTIRLQWKPENDFNSKGKIAVRNSDGRDVQISDIAGVAFSGGDLDGPTKDRDGGVRYYTQNAGVSYPSPQTVVVKLSTGQVLTFSVQNTREKNNSIEPSKVEGGAPVDPEPPSDPANGALFRAEGNTLHLRSDFASAAGRVTAYHSINNPTKAGHDGSGASKNVSLHVNRSGNIWSVERDLASYPEGNEPNTWAIRRNPSVPYPDGVTYHRDLADTSFIRPGATVTYPPTTK